MIAHYHAQINAPLIMYNWKQQVRQLKQDTYAIYLACKDSRVPWYARVLATFIVAYALSPLDLIPDFIPILGYLDDLILVPLGIMLVVRMIPPDVMAECRVQAATAINSTAPKSRLVAIIIVAIWFILGMLTVVWIGHIWKR